MSIKKIDLLIRNNVTFQRPRLCKISDTIVCFVIENNFFVEFGFDYLAPVTDWLFEDDSLEFDSEFPEYLDEDELMSFLNEFYVVYPDKIPPAQYE